MTIKNIYTYICLLVFVSFFFLWNVKITNIPDINIISYNFKNISIKFNYLIFFLIFFIFLKKKNYEHFFQQKKILIICLFIIVHYLINSIYDSKFQIKNIVFIVSIPILAFIYCNYRQFLLDNFKKILFIFFIIFIFFSIYENIIYNIGSCNADYFLIEVLKNKLNLTFSNSFFAENSHLAMMMVAVIYSSIFIATNNEKKNILFLICLLISIFISILNFSTTFYVSYFISIIVLFIFLHKRISFYFYLLNLIVLIFFSSFFLQDSNCKKKITDFNVKSIMEQKVEKLSKNLTTVIYERSAIVTLRTLQNRPLGWGLNGMLKANEDFLDKYGYTDNITQKKIFIYEVKNQLKKAPYWVSTLNIEDGLNNFFKMITEFGIFSLIIFYIFLKYIINIKKINAFNIFIIVIFITQCIRGAGYINGGFIFCIFEFLYFCPQNSQSKQSPSR